MRRRPMVSTSPPLIPALTSGLLKTIVKALFFKPFVSAVNGSTYGEAAFTSHFWCQTGSARSGPGADGWMRLLGRTDGRPARPWLGQASHWRPAEQRPARPWLGQASHWRPKAKQRPRPWLGQASGRRSPMGRAVAAQTLSERRQ